MNRKTKPMPERSLPSRPGKPTGLQEARAAKAPGALRRAAEARLRGRPATHPPQNQDDPKRLWHELIVHQVELEMQNEELRRAQTEIESALGQYAGLYDFAPVGYLTLRPDSTIQKLNLAAAELLRIERSRLLRRRFGVFVAAEDRAAFAALLTRAFETKAAEIGVLRLSPQDKPSIAVHLRACAAEDGRECGVALTDITELKRTELALREAEGRYHGLFEAASDAVLLVDQKTGQILEANAAALSCMAIPGKRSWR